MRHVPTLLRRELGAYFLGPMAYLILLAFQAIAWLKNYLAQADVLVQNLRPGVIEELGLGAKALQKINPRLIFCSLWAFGHTGPRRLRPGGSVTKPIFWMPARWQAYTTRPTDS